jgi:hypothetical protein
MAKINHQRAHNARYTWAASRSRSENGFILDLNLALLWAGALEARRAGNDLPADESGAAAAKARGVELWRHSKTVLAVQNRAEAVTGKGYRAYRSPRLRDLKH